ncbi:MAG TPA: FkbM family methyltransferase [Bryobacteraceae bacterium]|jgi:FkbM family methyltransferase|nr:FkbM family methyltransferase [Bryobacteraceae bacterium]
MINLSHFVTLRETAKSLGLGVGDTLRFIWSYYASRLRNADLQAQTEVSIFYAGARRKVAIRKNGWDWSVLDEVFVRRLYDLPSTQVRRVLDLGGNIGAATLALAWDHPGAEICAVEPIPTNLAVLQRNIELNQVRARVVPAAAGVESGKVTFNVSSDPRCHSSSMATLGGTEALEVNVVTVPQLMELMGWDEFDLLKIDIEGGEREILGSRAQWLTKVRYIVGEGHDGVGYDLAKIRADLEPLGFDVKLVERNEGAATVFQAERVRAADLAAGDAENKVQAANGANYAGN